MKNEQYLRLLENHRAIMTALSILPIGAASQRLGEAREHTDAEITHTREELRLARIARIKDNAM